MTDAESALMIQTIENLSARVSGLEKREDTLIQVVRSQGEYINMLLKDKADRVAPNHPRLRIM